LAKPRPLPRAMPNVVPDARPVLRAIPAPQETNRTFTVPLTFSPFAGGGVRCRDPR